MRYTRHELKQDKFAESTLEAIREALEHRSGILRIGIVVVILGLLASGAYFYMNSREEQAENALGRAMLTYNAPVVPAGTPPPGSMIIFHSDQERLITAKKDFYAISDKYGWTAAGQYARYMAGVTEQELGNDKVAADQLRALTHSRRHQLAALAKLALASVYRGEKQYQDAIDVLQSLINKPTVTVPKVTAQLALADIYVAQNQPDKAKVIYDQIAKENAKNGLGELAKTRQEALK